MSKTDPINDDANREEDFAVRLEQLDDAISQSSNACRYGTTANPQSFGKKSCSDSRMLRAAHVLRMIYRVRDFERQSGSQVDTDTQVDPTATANASRPGATSSGDIGLVAYPDMIGRFKVHRLIGKGGFGLVFLAEDTALNRMVAIKLPRPEVLFDATTTERFLREGQATAALNHPNIVPVHEVGHVGNIGFIASGYCAGGTLSDWLRNRSQPLHPRAAAALTARLADAVQHAHRRSVFHRDLKPSNVLLDSVEGESDSNEFKLADIARISDFGLAKFDEVGASLTLEGSSIGTPSYMPPEQADHGVAALGPTADVYSLGAILYELLCGRPPFEEGSALATLEAVRHREPKSPRRIAQGIPGDLEAITLKCLEKKPEHRYTSALELADDLERFLDGQPVRARSIGATQRCWRWCRRNPVVATLALAVVMLAIGSTLASVQLALSKQQVEAALADTVLANRQAAASEYNAQVAYAQTIQQSLRPGRRTESLRALQRAANLAQQIGTMPTEQLRLRNAVIAGASFSDLVVDKRWPIRIVGERFLATDPECEVYARVDTDRREVLLHRIEDNEVQGSLPLAANHQRLIGLRFSRDGSWLGARYQIPSLEERLRVWDLSTSAVVVDERIGGIGKAADFSPSGDAMALVRHGGRAIELRTLPSFSLVREIPVESTAQTIALDPTGTNVAIHRPSTIDIVSLESNERTHQLDFPAVAIVMSFSPDGQKLALGCRDGTIRIVDLDHIGAEDAVAYRTLESHTSIVVNLNWHPQGNLLASSSMDGESLLWDINRSRPILEFDEKFTSFSKDGVWLGIEGGRMRLEQSDSHRVFTQSDSRVYTPFDLGFYGRRDVTSEIDYWITLPNSSLVIGQNYFRMVARDLSTSVALLDVEVPACWFRFDSQGNWLYASSQTAGFCRLPVVREESEAVVKIRIGPPEKVHAARGGAFAVSDTQVLLTPYLSSGLVLNPDDWNAMARLNVHPLTFWCDLSPDGRLAATGVVRAQNVQVFDAVSGKQIQTLASLTAAPWFFPDGRRLVVAENARYTVFDTENWKPVKRIESPAGGIWPGSLAFSPDGDLLALEVGSSVQLVDPRDYSTLAELRVPPTERIESLGFSGDGRYLVSGGADQDRTHVWDLWRIRRHLRRFGLDWVSEEDSLDTQPTHRKPIDLELDLGELTRRPQLSDWQRPSGS